MAGTRSSTNSTPTRTLRRNASRTPQTPPPRLEVEYATRDEPIHVSDDDHTDLMDDTENHPEHNLRQTTVAVVSEDVEMLVPSPSPPSRKARKRTTCQETQINSDTVHFVSKQMDQEVIMVDDESDVDQEPPVKGHLRQTCTELVEIPTPAVDESSRQSSAGPETPHQNSGTKETDQSQSTEELNDVIKGMCKAIRKGLSVQGNEKVGRVYFLEDTSGETTRFKIGSTVQKVEKRVNEHVKKCGLTKNWKHKPYPDFPFRGYVRLEKITHKELSHMRVTFDCYCGTCHTEYFDGEKEVARGTLRFWAEWLKTCQPYDNDGSLLPFWTARLEYFEKERDHWFKCLTPGCKRPSACQACLRAGWKAWTEPTRRDHVKFWLWSSIPIPNISFHLIGCLTAASLLLSLIPLSATVKLLALLHQLEITVMSLTYLWIYKEGISNYLTAPSDKPTHTVQSEVTTPQKQPEMVETPRTAPARLLHVSRMVEQSGITPARTSPQGQIPNTEPILDRRVTGARNLAPDESPSKAAQRRRASKSPTPPSERDIEEALKRSFGSLKRDGGVDTQG